MRKQASAKRCLGCAATKDLREFGRDHRSPDGLRDLCRPCRRNELAEAAKLIPDARRRGNLRLEALYPERKKAENAVRTEIRSGRMKRRPCAMCGDPKTHAHHSSYRRADWLKITWLCNSHHRLVHMDPNHPLNPDRLPAAKQLPLNLGHIPMTRPTISPRARAFAFALAAGVTTRRALAQHFKLSADSVQKVIKNMLRFGLVRECGRTQQGVVIALTDAGQRRFGVTAAPVRVVA